MASPACPKTPYGAGQVDGPGCVHGRVAGSGERPGLTGGRCGGESSPGSRSGFVGAGVVSGFVGAAGAASFERSDISADLSRVITIIPPPTFLIQILRTHKNELIDSLGVHTVTTNRLNEWPNMLTPE